MSTIKRFEDLRVCQRARQLVNSIYDLIESGSFRRDWVLIDQLKRSSLSIMSNPAEGFERDGRKEFIHFLSTAKAGELRSHLYVAIDRHYIESETFIGLNTQALHLSRMIARLIRHLRTSDIAGTKFRESKPET
jgi:four helix bundle protein